MTVQDFRLPDLGEGLPEAELVQWTVAVGEEVTLNQTIAEVETAKAVVELPSPFAGTVHALHAEAGDTIEVGAVLISFEVAGAGEAPDAGTADAEEGRTPHLVGYGAAEQAGGRPQRRARRSVAAGGTDTAVLEAAPHDVLPEQPVDARLRERPRSTPPVRILARTLGIDLATITGTGPDGTVTRADVEGHAAGGARAEVFKAVVPPAAGADVGRARETRTPIRGVRKATAAAMVQSAFTAPTVTVFLSVDVTESMRLLASLREDRALAGHRIGVLALVAKAVCLALRAQPELNSRWDEAAGEIVTYGYVNLGIAAATDRGLVVPNIADADQLTLPELADAIAALAATARAGSATPANLRGGTFSITNVGVFGVDAGTPILNPGEAGILALGQVRRQPWEHAGEIALRDVTTLALSFDHRLVDGAEGSRFLRTVADVLTDPGRALLLR